MALDPSMPVLIVYYFWDNDQYPAQPAAATWI